MITATNTTMITSWKPLPSARINANKINRPNKAMLLLLVGALAANGMWATRSRYIWLYVPITRRSFIDMLRANFGGSVKTNVDGTIRWNSNNKTLFKMLLNNKTAKDWLPAGMLEFFAESTIGEIGR